MNRYFVSLLSLVLISLISLPQSVASQTKPAKAKRHHLSKPASAAVDSAIRDTTGPQPGIDDFIDVTAEPLVLHPIDSGLKYPEAALRAGVEGKVVLAALLEKDGCVSKVVVQRSDSKLLNSEAERLMLQARFRPAMQNDAPVRVWMSQTIVFHLPRQ